MSGPTRRDPAITKPGLRTTAVVQTTDRHDTSSVDYAIGVLGDILNVAFGDARRLDHLARLISKAFAGIGFDDRIALADQHPRLVEGLILLEDAVERMDRR